MLEVLSLSSLGVAFLASLTGSLHCVAMCGPIRLLSGEGPKQRFAYQGGRAIAYATLGSLAGAVGWAMPFWALVPLVFFALTFNLGGARLPLRWQKWRNHFVKLASVNPFFLGVASGLLPCGLLHSWVAAAAATASPLWGGLLLGMLWLGTLPALEASSWLIAKPFRIARGRFPRLVPAAFLLVALVPIFLRAQSYTQPVPAGADQPSCHSMHDEHVH